MWTPLTSSPSPQKENIQLVCVDNPQKKSLLREFGKLGSNHAVKFSKTKMRHAKIRERKGLSHGVMQKCALQERIPWASKFEDETLKQEGCARRDASGQRMFLNSTKESQETFYSPAEAWVIPRRAIIRNRLQSVCAHAQVNWKLVQDPETHHGGNGQWRSVDERGSTRKCSRS